MTEKPSFREEMKAINETYKKTSKENNANMKAQIILNKEKRITDAKARDEQIKVKQLVKAERIAHRPEKVKGPSGFGALMKILWMAPMMLFCLVAIIGISTFGIMLLWSIFFG
jgi:hypothetical protein